MKMPLFEKLLSRSHQLGAHDFHAHMLRLAKEKGFFEMIFNTLHEGIVVLSEEGRIEYFNRAASSLLGLPEEKALQTPINRYLRGLPWHELLHQGQASSRRIEVDYPQKRVLEFYLLPVAKESEPKESFVAIFHDITQSHKAAEMTIESERIDAVMLLAAGVAHELGNPLNNLNIHMQLIERELHKLREPPPQELSESVEIARNEFKRLDGIIRQFLQAIRPSRPDLTPASIRPVIEETLKLTAPELKNRDIFVEIESPPHMPQVMLDCQQIQQAFYNILHNAISAIGQTGIIKIRVEACDAWLMLSFSDNGSGIAPADIPHVQKPYFTTHKHGNGLGLMIVQRIVREHGGELEIESQKNQGTTVRIKLPRIEKHVRTLPSPSISSDHDLSSTALL